MVLANILRYTVEGFADIPAKVIAEKYLRDPYVTNNEEGLNELIRSVDKEYGLIEYDTLFQAERPAGDIVDTNIEMQTYETDYELDSRVQFYAYMLVTSQKVYKISRGYGDLHACRSIWICTSGKNGRHNELHFSYNCSHYDDRKRNYVPLRRVDMVGIVYIFLGDPDEPGIVPLLRMLDVIFCMRYNSVEEKNSILREEFGFEIHNRRVLKKMCNISLGLNAMLEEECIEKGIEKGIAIGIEKEKKETFLTRVEGLKTMLADRISEETAFRYLCVTSEEEKRALLAATKA